MSSTSTFLGLDPESRSSSRVLRPPGGGSNFSLSPSEQQQQQPVRRHKMASNIFGIPDDPAPASCASETEGSQGAACGDPEDPQKTCQQGDSEEVSDHMGEGEIPEIAELGKEASGESRLPAAPVAVPSRRNPPGGKSSLVLG